MTVDTNEEALPLTVDELKMAGNEAFKNSEYRLSVDAYAKALELASETSEKVVLYKNRAMARLKLEDFEGAEADCSAGWCLFIMSLMLI